MIQTMIVLQPLIGGVLIGASAVLLMGTLGRIAGISGIVGGLLSKPRPSDFGWRLAFLAGLVVAPILLSSFTGIDAVGAPTVHGLWIPAAGFLVGFGTQLGSGCTSGHGVCGLARLSPRSLVAAAVFMSTGMATVFVTHHLIRAIFP
jgi:uncharacterized protein